jgi:DNA-binding MarR family transcriptional regulator
MGIEEDIQQRKDFRSEFHKASVNIIYSSNWILEKVKEFVNKEDITPQQYNILRILRGSPTPISTLQIRERMLDKMSDTSRLVERLVKKELVDKKISAVDKRLVDVSISEKGLQLLDRLDEQNEELDSVTNRLTTAEALMLNQLLDKMRGS